MSKRIFQQASWTPTAQVDQVLTGAFQAIKPGTSTDIMKIGKIICQGQANTAALNVLCMARSSTLAITPTALALPNSDGPANTNATPMTNVPVAFIAAGTAPNRSPAVTIARLPIAFNAFGGIAVWQTNPGSEEEWTSFGNATTSQSESVLSAINVPTPGLMGSTFYYEIL